jgi:SAM-dependent methyltransferase
MEALGRWLGATLPGRVLDLGAGDGAIALWLGKQGYLVDAVESDLDKAQRLEQARQGLPIVVHPLDLRDFPLIPGTYSLVVAAAVLHFLRPSELWPLADRLTGSLVAGGLVMAEALTTDDPEAVDLSAAGTDPLEPNTYTSNAPEGLIHFFEPGELRRVFQALEILEYEEFRRSAPEWPGGYRSGATLVGRRGA